MVSIQRMLIVQECCVVACAQEVPILGDGLRYHLVMWMICTDKNDSVIVSCIFVYSGVVQKLVSIQHSALNIGFLDKELTFLCL